MKSIAEAEQIPRNLRDDIYVTKYLLDNISYVGEILSAQSCLCITPASLKHMYTTLTKNPDSHKSFMKAYLSVEEALNKVSGDATNRPAYVSMYRMHTAFKFCYEKVRSELGFSSNFESTTNARLVYTTCYANRKDSNPRTTLLDGNLQLYDNREYTYTEVMSIFSFYYYCKSDDLMELMVKNKSVRGKLMSIYRYLRAPRPDGSNYMGCLTTHGQIFINFCETMFNLLEVDTSGCMSYVTDSVMSKLDNSYSSALRLFMKSGDSVDELTQELSSRAETIAMQAPVEYNSIHQPFVDSCKTVLGIDFVLANDVAYLVTNNFIVHQFHEAPPSDFHYFSERYLLTSHMMYNFAQERNPDSVAVKLVNNCVEMFDIHGHYDQRCSRMLISAAIDDQVCDMKVKLVNLGAMLPTTELQHLQGYVGKITAVNTCAMDLNMRIIKEFVHETDVASMARCKVKYSPLYGYKQFISIRYESMT